MYYNYRMLDPLALLTLSSCSTQALVAYRGVPSRSGRNNTPHSIQLYLADNNCIKPGDTVSSTHTHTHTTQVNKVTQVQLTHALTPHNSHSHSTHLPAPQKPIARTSIGFWVVDMMRETDQISEWVSEWVSGSTSLLFSGHREHHSFTRSLTQRNSNSCPLLSSPNHLKLQLKH